MLLGVCRCSVVVDVLLMLLLFVCVADVLVFLCVAIVVGCVFVVAVCVC